jgi:hypothetical protein
MLTLSIFSDLFRPCRNFFRPLSNFFCCEHFLPVGKFFERFRFFRFEYDRERGTKRKILTDIKYELSLKLPCTDTDDNADADVSVKEQVAIG